MSTTVECEGSIGRIINEEIPEEDEYEVVIQELILDEVKEVIKVSTSGKAPEKNTAKTLSIEHALKNSFRNSMLIYKWKIDNYCVQRKANTKKNA